MALPARAWFKGRVLANAGPILLVIVVIIGAIVAAVIAAKKAHERRMALRAWAENLGWRFSPEKDHGMDERFATFDKLREGSDRYAENVMRGEHEGLTCWAFDYHYETYSTNSKGQRTTHHHWHSMVIVDSRLALQPLSIGREHFFHKIAGALGWDDIDFESAEFSRKFLVRAPDRRWAYDVINQRAMELLLDSPRFAIELFGPHVLAYRSGRLKAHEYDQALKLSMGLLDCIPEDIVKRLRIQ